MKKCPRLPWTTPWDLVTPSVASLKGSYLISITTGRAQPNRMHGNVMLLKAGSLSFPFWSVYGLVEWLELQDFAGCRKVGLCVETRCCSCVIIGGSIHATSIYFHFKGSVSPSCWATPWQALHSPSHHVPYINSFNKSYSTRNNKVFCL